MSTFLRGRPDNPKGIEPGEQIVRLRDCPDCNGPRVVSDKPICNAACTGGWTGEYVPMPNVL